MTPYIRPAVWTVLAMGIFSASHALSKINLQILPPAEVPDLHTLLGILLIATSGILLVGGGKKA